MNCLSFLRRFSGRTPVIDIFLKGENIAGTKVYPFDGANILAVTRTHFAARDK